MRKNGLLTRLKIACTAFNSSKNALVLTCNECGSFNIAKLNSEKNGQKYEGLYICRDCGTMCYESQLWGNGEVFDA